MLTFAPGMRSTFPQDDYTPFGYLHTPHHTGIVPSGLLRSVEPLGFGLYRRGFSWYGMDALNGVNAYLSLLLPSLRVNGILLAETEDFVSHHVKLVSRYHSSNIMTYDFCIEGMSATLAWFSDKQDTLILRSETRTYSVSCLSENQASVALIPSMQKSYVMMFDE